MIGEREEKHRDIESMMLWPSVKMCFHKMKDYMGKRLASLNAIRRIDSKHRFPPLAMNMQSHSF